MKKDQTQIPAVPKAIRIESAAQLKKLIEAPLFCRIIIDRQLVEIPVQRLSSATAERVRALYRKARAPWNKMLKGGQGDYDETDPKFQAEHALNAAVARSVTVYCHCPLVAGQKPGLMDDKQIHEFVNDLFSDGVLDTMSLMIRGGGLQLEDLVNFTSRAG